MEKCHNNVYLVKFHQFVKILFKYGTEITILNAVIKVNLVSDLLRFLMEFVNNVMVRSQSDLYLWFFKDLVECIEQAIDVFFFP